MRRLGVWLCGLVGLVVTVSAGCFTASDPGVASAKTENPSAVSAKPVTWTKLVKAAVNPGTLQKSGGCDGCPDAGAVSEQQIGSSGGYMELTASETTTLRAIGLTSGTPGTAPNEIRFSFLFQPGGVVEIREGGQYRLDTPFVAGDVLRIGVQAGVGAPVVRYYKNGKLLYRSTVTPDFPLSVAASLLSLSSTLTKVVIYP